MSAPRRFLRGIRDKLILSFALLILSIAVFVLAFFPAQVERQAMRALIAKAEAIRDMASYTVSSAIVFDDSAAVRVVLAGAARDKDVAFVAVHDVQGRWISLRGIAADAPALGDSAHGYVTRDGHTYVTSAPVFHRDAKVGTLIVGLSLDELRADVWNARWLGATIAAFIFAVGVLVVYAISTLVTRPLTAVSDTVERIGAGDLTLRAEETPDIEVARFVRVFNQTVTSLAGAQQELARNNQQLEARVEARTAEARATSETLQSLIDVAPEAIIAVDLDWRVTRWNRAAEALFGWSADEVIGEPIPYIPPAERAAFEARRAVVERGRDVGASEVTRVRKDGSLVNVLFSAAALRGRNQELTGYIGVATDLTERKLLEEQLRQAQKMEAIGRLAGGVAHDFNNILTVITSSAGMLLEGRPSDRERYDLEQIAAAAARAAALTRQLLTFSKKHVVHLQAVDVGEVVRQTEPMLRRLLRAHIMLSSHIGADAGIVTADPVQLEQVVMNLVVNASDAMPDGGVLTIETRNVILDDDYAREQPDAKAGPYVLLSVTDTGVGMDPTTMSRIFEPFFTTKDVGHGTGLGLAIVYAVVTQLGGHVRVTSDVGRGTTFFVYIPRATAPKPNERTLTPALVDAVVPAHETVLLVEDEDIVRRLVHRTLDRFGYRVLEAPDGESGLRVAAAHFGAIDVVVTDLMMPGMNGRTFAERLSETRPGVRVVFMSGYADETINRGGMMDDTHTFLQKPFTGTQLVRAIQQVMARV